MVKYAIKRDKDGRRIGIGAADKPMGKPVEVKKPNGPTLPGAQQVVFQCVACEVDGKNTAPRFKLKAILANHFKKVHQSLYLDRDTWKNYVREIVLED